MPLQPRQRIWDKPSELMWHKFVDVAARGTLENRWGTRRELWGTRTELVGTDGIVDERELNWNER
jgi:hypothetical protein